MSLSFIELMTLLLYANNDFSFLVSRGVIEETIKVVRNKKSKFFSHCYLIEFYETNRMSQVPHLYDIVILLK